MENPVRTTTLEVIKQTEHVKINRERIDELAEEWVKKKLTAPFWPKEYHLQTADRQKMLDYLIILDSINFCFWNKIETREEVDCFFLWN